MARNAAQAQTILRATHRATIRAMLAACGDTAYMAAPMVNASEQAFRLLARRHNTHICFTPMLHSRLMVESEGYRRNAMHDLGDAADAPLIVQFCGNDPDTLLRAGRHVEAHCAAVDINLGCPQGIARKGNYGAFLLEKTSLLERIVLNLSGNLAVPVTCKIRLLSTLDATLDLARRLEKAGCAMLTVHGRTKEEMKDRIGMVDWEAIKLIREAVKIPVIANGGLATFDDVAKCVAATGVAGVMSSEALLENPAFFNPERNAAPAVPAAESAEAESAEAADDAFLGESSKKRPRIEAGGSSETSNASGSSSGTGTGALVGGAGAGACPCPWTARQFVLAREYCEIASTNPPKYFKVVKAHMIKYLFSAFMADKKSIQRHFEARSMEDMIENLASVEMNATTAGHPVHTALAAEPFPVNGPGPWYARHGERKGATKRGSKRARASKP